ncbi:MAG: hypothetical protein MAG581_00475 [Deltaproteobacteria bacterium]|nr:hypothetical protein [Deltaproteobacteria bacterium]
MFDTITAIVIFGAVLLSGLLKGIIGVGFQTVGLAFLTIITNLPNAISLLLIPSLVTNIWQAAVGREFFKVLLRLWPLILTASTTVWLGTIVLTSVALSFLTALLGVVLILYSALNLSGLRFEVKPKHEWWIAPLIGFVNGILTGMTGIFVVPCAFYFQAIGLSRDTLIQSMGILFTALTIVLTVSLQTHNILTLELAGWSAMAIVPAILGVLLGQFIRHRISENVFNKFFFISLIFLGSFITFNAF